MSNGYGWQDPDPYAADDPWARGVRPGRGDGGRPSAGEPPYGAQQYAGQLYGGSSYGDARNDYGRAPADTDAGRGGAHKWSVALVLLYFGLPLLVTGLVALVLVLTMV